MAKRSAGQFETTLTTIVSARSSRFFLNHHLEDLDHLVRMEGTFTGKQIIEHHSRHPS